MLELVYFFYQVVLGSLSLLTWISHFVINEDVFNFLISPFYQGEARYNHLSYLYNKENLELFIEFSSSEKSFSATLINYLYLLTLQIDLVFTFLNLDHDLSLSSSVLGTFQFLWPDFSSPINSLTVKVVASISFLIVIRGGVPRYRYDFLTKIGWVKFLIFIISLLLSTFLLYFAW